MQISWKAYEKIYWNFVLSIRENELVSQYTSHIFNDFPKNLPSTLKKKFFDEIKKVKSLFEIAEKALSSRLSGEELISSVELQNSTRKKKKLKKKISKRNNPDLSKGAYVYTKMALAAINTGRKSPRNDLSQIFFSQDLVMLLAHFEAFLSDSVKIIHLSRPEKLKRNIKIDWSELIDFKSIDELHEHLTEKITLEFGWLSYENKFNTLSSTHGIDIKISKLEKKFLLEAESKRHLFVHNGGKYTKQYSAKKAKKSITPGNKVHWTNSHNAKLRTLILKLSSQVYSKICNKYFGIKGNSMHKFDIDITGANERQ